MASGKELLQQIQSYAARLTQSVAEAEFWHNKTLEYIELNRQEQLKEIEAKHAQSMATASSSYEKTFAQVEADLAKLEADHTLAESSWDDLRWQKFVPSTEINIPYLTRIGRLVTQGNYSQIEMSALLPIIGSRNVLIKAKGPGKETARVAIQSIMLRLLVTLPPGKLRFVCIDPVGLGTTMAGFIKELPDFITSGRAWFDQRHIEEQLAELEARMSLIKTKYLGVSYPTMEEYNNMAGEIKEPYRFLVVSDFPARFSDSAAQRLISIATNGPSTGVYVLAMVDEDQPKMPYGFNLEDLERMAEVIECKRQTATWQDPDFKNCILELDHIPHSKQFEKIVKAVGKTASEIEALGVKVSFNADAPTPEQWWQDDARNGINIPIGRVGAEDLQQFEFNEKLESSALIIGRPGSGKSTLLHTLITGLSLHYSPDELELYLIDFKQVEFKDYALQQLPHARVIAVKSEREFGLSVLHRLDLELQMRKDKFKNIKALSEYRTKHGERLPRILLVADEFQELFSDDDALARKAAEILDRLVRQGRAFGINTVLASQTLSGPYSLSRATKDQIPVRIALQCADADSRMVLSDENDQARLLERPGEAIYNATNGRIEGNNQFQVFWLSVDQRESYLCQIRERALSMKWTPPERQIVFDGDAPANIAVNQELVQLLDIPDWPSSQRAYNAWIGEPIEIKSHTAASFRRQSGSNLLILGQNEHEPTVTAMLATSLLSLAAQHRPEMASFVVLNLTDVDANWHNVMDIVVKALPHSAQVVRRKGVVKAIEEVSAELARRSEEDDIHWPNLYLAIVGLHRARDLRLPENYSSYSDEPKSPAAQLSTICRDGPDLGIHTLLWSDTYANLERTLDRGPERFFDLRVALQMNADDSRRLLDSDAANKLGPNRVLYTDEERTGRLEKFRPYGLPELMWIEELGGKMRKRLERRR